MLRSALIPVVALVGVLAPSVVRAQEYVVSPCGDGCARVSVIPAPPTGVPAWLQPKPAAQPAAQPVVPPMPVYVAPPAPRGGGIDPWIPLAVQPAPVARPGDLLGQLLLLQQLRAAREYAAPAVVAPTPQGSLCLKIKPREGQVYVDGVFAGTVADFDGPFQKLPIDGGSHRIKITAPGHDTISFDVWITPNEIVTYKGKLPRVQ
jgi:hypothetical protein